MKCEAIPTKTYVLTLTEVEAQALMTLTGMQSRHSIENVALASSSFSKITAQAIETICVVNDRIYSTLDWAQVTSLK